MRGNARPALIGSGAPADSFPPDEAALTDPNGLIAVGGDLAPERLLSAYRRGIFPWYEAGQPILWWTPDPRCVLDPCGLHTSRSLRRRLRREDFEVSFDTDFSGVIRSCAEPREPGGGTWITPEMIRAYETLHKRGSAHSIEVRRDGRLAGGLYGVTIGAAFFGESMFSREADASKVALASLCKRLAPSADALIDCQVVSTHLLGLGAKTISRTEFRRRLNAALRFANLW
ncbi:MAG: leucyl/phenylalanyl-tRNA--protein transferase [Gammaproteobacteria bacterium]